MTVEVVLFDLGGVVIRLSGAPELLEWRGEDLPAVVDRWMTCPWVRQFESGRCGPDEFATGFIDSWELPVGEQRFLEVFRRLPVEIYAGVRETIENLPAQVQRACLSNTNELHWGECNGRWDLDDWFERCYLSHELGMMKPDHEIFEHVIADLGAPAESVLFLDDTAVNVQAAREVGMQAEQVVGTDAVRRVLSERGLF